MLCLITLRAPPAAAHELGIVSLPRPRVSPAHARGAVAACGSRCAASFVLETQEAQDRLVARDQGFCVAFPCQLEERAA
jgi:hypothetical protein